ncbi:MAG: EI24 domain-containing protein [Pseudomonadota bacterium]
MALISDFLRAVGQMTDRRFLWILIKAVGLTLGLLIAVSTAGAWAVGLLPDPLFSLPWIGDISLPLSLLQGAALGGFLIASMFLMFPVAAIFIGLFLDQVADAVEARYYPDVGETRTPGIVEGLLDGLGFAGVVIIANLLALIVYLLLPPFAPFIFYALNGYLMGREFFQMIAGRHRGRAEAVTLRKRYWVRVWLAGMLVAVPLSIPVLNLLAPVLGVASMTHLYHRLSRKPANLA